VKKKWKARAAQLPDAYAHFIYLDVFEISILIAIEAGKDEQD
jgi:hypothetical protein